jgi:hypothetical protein
MSSARAAALRVSSLLAGAALVVVAAVPARAQESPAASIDAAVCVPSPAADGARCYVAGSGFPANTTARIGLEASTVEAAVDARGSFATRELLIYGRICGRAPEVLVVAPGPAGPVRATAQVQASCTLARTGRSDVGPLALLGLGLTTTGCAFVVAARRRGRHAAPLLALPRGRHEAASPRPAF